MRAYRVLANVIPTVSIGELVQAAGMSDEQLCYRLADLDQQALAQLYDRHGRQAFALAVRITRSREAAEDIVQMSFIKLWRAPRLYSPDRGSFRGWFLRIVSNLAIDQVRKDATQQRLGSAISEQIEADHPVADPFEEVARRLGSAAVHRAMGSLPRPQRQVLELAYFKDRSLPEIAALTSLPVTTIKGRMRLALQKMRLEIAQPSHRTAPARIGAGSAPGRPPAID